MLFLRIFRHLLPDGAAWKLVAEKVLQKFFEGLAESPADARQYIDDVHNDLFPLSTRELGEWEAQFGLPGSGDEAERRQILDAAWKAQGGQSPRYLQDVMQAAGFDVFIHEWWDPAALPSVVTRNPHDYTEQPLIGSIQCRPLTGPPAGAPFLCRAPGPTAYRCNNWLANETHYIVNLNLTRAAPPAVPSDPDTYPYFLYWGGETFGTFADVPAERRGEFERLLKKLCPSHLWLVTLVNYV
jgi:hypothetical protein